MLEMLLWAWVAGYLVTIFVYTLGVSRVGLAWVAALLVLTVSWPWFLRCGWKQFRAGSHRT